MAQVTVGQVLLGISAKLPTAKHIPHRTVIPTRTPAPPRENIPSIAPSNHPTYLSLAVINIRIDNPTP